jgi:hypothetical protein
VRTFRRTLRGNDSLSSFVDAAPHVCTASLIGVNNATIRTLSHSIDIVADIVSGRDAFELRCALAKLNRNDSIRMAHALRSISKHLFAGAQAIDIETFVRMRRARSNRNKFDST